MSSIKNAPWWVHAIVVALLTVLGTLYTESRLFKTQTDFTDKQTIISRVANLEAGQQKLEAHQQDDHEKLTYIQHQVDRLVEWALGHK